MPSNPHPAGTPLRVGFIGLGSQGGPIARRIVDSGFETTLWARRQQSLDPFAETGALIAASPADLGKASDLVGICVDNDAAVEQVVSGPQGVLGGLQPGGIIVIHSTIHPDTCRRLASEASSRGIAVIDAPVSGGGEAAAERRLLVMVGGDEVVLERCRSVLATFANPIVHLGGVGAGQVTKLLNNTLLAANIGTTLGILDIGRSLGVDVPELAEVMSHGSGASFALTVLRHSIDNIAAFGESAEPLLRKDVGLLADVADEGEVGAAAWSAARTALQRMCEGR